MRVGVAGTGSIVPCFLEAAALIEGIEIGGIYTRARERAQPIAAKYGIPAIYTDYPQMMADRSIDTVYVASVNSMHYAQAKRALEAGKNVICEKPFVSTVDEFIDLKRIAKKNRRFLFEAILPIHAPNFRLIQSNIGKLGRIKMVQGNFSQYSRRYDALKRGETPAVFDPALSGGALADINIYNLHLTVGLFGTPQRVHYFPNKHENGIDTSGVAVMSYDGFQAVCVACKDSAGKKYFQIQGDAGYILIDSEISRCRNVTLHCEGQATQLGPSETGNGMVHELEDFLHIVNDNDLEECGRLLDHSERVMRVFQAAREDGGIFFAADHKEV
ncbi:Gfo/Idh/MocA family protein [Allofournierella sp.]|uniref:Gfo/Idh/MocA family protein n=1 Tax=Allofournierella sp. TaxID=1940256 RepID=UPI003AEF4185